MSQLTEIISKFAPLIGSIIPLPGAAIIGDVVGAAFGGSMNNEDDLASKISSDPEAAVKLKQIEANMQVQLQQIAAQQAQAQISLETAAIQADASDRASARNMSIETKSNVQTVMISFLSITICMLLFYLCKYGLPDNSNSNSILYMLIGQVSAGFGMALNFFFGTSASSSKKDDMIFNSTPIMKIK